MQAFKRPSQFAGIVLLTAASACAPKHTNTVPEAQSAQTAVVPAPGKVVSGSAEDFRVNVGDRVLFAYDRKDINEDGRATLKKQADWLAKYPSVTVTVEGHCDERGTREYNIALGARRANSVREFLVSSGVSAQRIKTVSYGKEKGGCSISDESCWSQNRRGITVVENDAAS